MPISEAFRPVRTRFAVISVRASSISLWMSSPSCEVSEPKRSPNDRSLLGAAMLEHSGIRGRRRGALADRAATRRHVVRGLGPAHAGAGGIPAARLVGRPAVTGAAIAGAVALVGPRSATRARLEEACRDQPEHQGAAHEDGRLLP